MAASHTQQIMLPGFNLPLNHTRQGKYSWDRTTLPNALDPQDIYHGYIGNLLVHREIIMLQIMNTISEKPDWDRKVFDDEITAKWRKEISESGQDVTPAMIDWILVEMRWKAKALKQEGTFTVFDHVGVVRSDTAIPQDLQKALRDAVAPLENIPVEAKDYHPGSDDKVLDLVHPSLFPLVYGRTRILPDRTMTVDDCLEHQGQGEVLPAPTDEESQGHGREPFWRWRASNYKVFSQKFQWLPCDVQFAPDGGCRIASYINNLHPVHHRDLYGVVEKMISHAIPQWDKSLTRTRQFNNTRILYDRVEYLDRSTPEPEWDEHGHEDNDDYDDEYEERRSEWWRTRPIKLPEPLSRFSPPQVSYEGAMNLREKFGETGLQVIVKLANIELSPEKPTYEGGSWHIEGQLNERICATAIYYYDSENITESRLAFRHRAESIDDTHYEQDQHEFIHAVYGFGPDVDGHNDGHFTQDLGSVLCNEGRLLTFPNTVQHRVAPFALADPTKSGHRKILALFLIDPNRRIISTANVPPQQAEWADGEDSLSGKLMTLEEAKEYRLELMKERSVLQDTQNQAFEVGSFSLCEH
ncbi:DUF4246 domain-containing protein [Aspergillus homomorphus CBS 101889]|uniref:Uncharacterized protein n=1 Tax=Aspergillus homomorphus (strain CBS 101889) TaxID=1450537 RepID=A0A395I7D8_ASPHC|nr:hypothetical protein BO97DRAFT_361940 [Aspergillus homomorphus CBS 101889]RAL15816.1 hypothetical protein BO97DRAFT_361940 [Aspergillus homomorphus CBS 101889]